jgi:UDP-N-acetylglucosamine:LPS N-acetylglucosamine transferase
MSFPEFEPGKKKVLFFSRGRGRGHAFPDMEIVKELQKQSDDVQVRFASYGTGARTIQQFGFPLIDLGLPEEGSLTQMSVLAGKLIGWLQPDLVISHEEFAVMPAAKIFDKKTVFVVDWFVEPDRLIMQMLSYADEILFLDDPGTYEEPSFLNGKIHYVGPLVRQFAYSRQDRARARQELELPRDAFVIGVFPGSWTEERVPVLETVLAAFHSLPDNPKRLLWVAGEDEALIRRRCEIEPTVKVFGFDPSIDRLYAAVDVAITKTNRKTVIELEAFGVPTVSLTNDLNPIDGRRARSAHVVEPVTVPPATLAAHLHLARGKPKRALKSPADTTQVANRVLGILNTSDIQQEPTGPLRAALQL